MVTYGGDMKADKFKFTPEQRLDDDEWHDVIFAKHNKQVRVNSIRFTGETTVRMQCTFSIVS